MNDKTKANNLQIEEFVIYKFHVYLYMQQVLLLGKVKTRKNIYIKM